MPARPRATRRGRSWRRGQFLSKSKLAKRLLTSAENYWTWDDAEFRRAWVRSPLDTYSRRAPGPVVLGELHKDRRWKSRLKGLFDVHGAGDGLIITGSARLDLYRRGGDRLLGRYLPYRLHPFSVGERATPPGPDEVLEGGQARYPLDDLLRLGGFPEPLLAGNEAKARRWSRLRLERLLAEDVRDLRAVSDLSGLQVLTELLPERVGSLLSLNALREDVGVSHATVAAWVQVLEALYHCFLLRPWTRRVARAVRSAPKLYLFDLLQLPAQRTGARLENVTALQLLKACHFWTDTAVGEFDLRFVRDKDGREVDFLVLRDKRPWLLVECKSGELEPDESLLRFRSQLGAPHAVQLVRKPGYARSYPALGVRVVDYERFFAGWV